MFRRKLCPHCKTGKYTYELDRHSPECPYLACHNGRKCAMYEKLDEPKKRSFLSRIFNKASYTPPKNRACNGVFKLFICHMERKLLAFATAYISQGSRKPKVFGKRRNSVMNEQ